MLHTLHLRRPSPGRVSQALRRHQRAPLSYPQVGATREDQAPEGFLPLRRRVRLGEGEEVWRRAQEALRGWAMFDLGWTALGNAPPPLEEGAPVAVLGSFMGLWSLNLGRVVYALREEDEGWRRLAVAFGTLGAHMMEGEERFTVEMERASQEVFFEIYSFSRASRWDSWLLLPMIRPLQRRFGLHCARHMVQLCQP